MNTQPIRAAVLAALAFASLAACSGDGPVAPDARRAPILTCPVNRVHADCEPPVHQPPPDTTTPTYQATYDYFPVHMVNYPDVYTKTVDIGAESVSHYYVALTTVADTIVASDCATGRYMSTTRLFASQQYSPAYVKAVQRYVYANPNGSNRWDVNATHTFVVGSGVTGGGTYHTSWSGCL